MSVHSAYNQYDSDASLSFNVDPTNPEEENQALRCRLLDYLVVDQNSSQVERQIRPVQNLEGDIQETANKIRDTIGSHSAMRAPKKPSIFDCIKGRDPFQIVCQTNTNYALSRYGQEIQIRYCNDDLFFMGYSVAILDFIYKHKDNETLHENLKGSYLAIIKQSVSQDSEETLEQILQNRESLESMISWLKSLAEPEAQYISFEKGNAHIEKMFETMGVFINVVKQKQSFSTCFRSTPEFDAIFLAQEPYGELIMRGKNQVSYFSG